jgi:hypothetical protein
VHLAILHLLTELASRYEPVKTVIGESKYLLAAFISTLSADSDLLWNSTSVNSKSKFDA